jgi:hypothetical protein
MNSILKNVALDSALSWMSFLLDGTPDEVILAYTPMTTNQSVVGTINLVEY